MIENVNIPFSFDIVLVLIFISYLVYGYFTGGHKQISIFIHLILPFFLLYYLGPTILKHIYIPLLGSTYFKFISTYLDVFKYSITMLTAYFLSYVVVLVSVFLLGRYAKKYILNENMKAHLGVYNNVVGAVVAFINTYVLIYFLMLPLFFLNIISYESKLTSVVLDNPPPFSRVAQITKNSVFIDEFLGKMNTFEQLFSADVVNIYFDHTIIKTHDELIGENSLETRFMEEVYPNLSENSKVLLDNAYFEKYETLLTGKNYKGVSWVLIQNSSNQELSQALIDTETAFQDYLDAEFKILDAYKKEVKAYQEAYSEFQDHYDLFLYDQAYKKYLAELEQYNEDPTGKEEPTFTETMPEGYLYGKDYGPPEKVVKTEEIDNALRLESVYKDKVNVNSEIKDYAKEFSQYRGLLKWYIEDLNFELSNISGGDDLSPYINDFKRKYDEITENVSNQETLDQLDQAETSILVYDVFTDWYACTMDTSEEGTNKVCNDFDVTADNNYNLTEKTSIVLDLLEGDNILIVLDQFKQDYEAGYFEDVFKDHETVATKLSNIKAFVDVFDEQYKEVAMGIDGNFSMVLKIAISVVKTNVDVYGALEDSPMLNAFFNDYARFCIGAAPSDINRNVLVCPESSGDGGIIRDVFRGRYLSTEVVTKAYMFVDENNKPRTFDYETMDEYLKTVNQSVQNNVFTKEVVSSMADEFAFNVVDEETNETLLEKMYRDGKISVEAMRLLAQDEYGLFSDDFKSRVRNLIR